MDAKAYKILHESFMQNNTGTTPWETVLVILPTAVLTILSNCLNIILINVTRNSFLIEFFVLVMPLVLNATVLSESISVSLTVFSLLTSFSVFVLYNYSPKRKLVTFSYLNKHLDISLVITNFRGTVNLITAVCILAVDFRSFPRRFAKTETFGWGLMDTGVGLFILANGLVDPVARNEPVALRKTTKGCFPMLFLGFLRWFSIWWLQYQQHVTEYGVHWNFFVTLAFTRLLSTLLLKIYKRPIFWALICVVGHEVLLQKGLTDFLLSTAPRDNLFLANREGICSLPGYVALHQAAVALGQWLHTKPAHKSINCLATVSSLSATMWLVALLSAPPSRRIANLSYIAWMLGFGGTMLALFVAVHIVSSALGVLCNGHVYMPTILNSINYNSLAFFLLANLLTGVINLSVPTLYVAPLGSLFIISTYMFLTTFTIYKLYLNRCKFKFW
ncbi:uncharacterized protein LOC132202637 [Neocloeon triangulifer]|uniref:uncharacterized protein LOC132202637 n=1 Tax=Neocloeon triangulifer TaxID=2078957 RepID=UPI00286F1CEC|nr:uncharacterized protein LOC132202637 [Neocloeon triangulifer]XP_059485638.1 uncharacterized protein LOC132202637 [Neocloeon triangulifer]XP_059485639.1 uncharacterized protein LOC132202637 [Neocloeon triangulifer]